MESTIEWWIKVGARLDGAVFIREALKQHRFKGLYVYLMEHHHVAANSINEETSLFCMATKYGNKDMIRSLFEWGAKPCDDIKRHCLALVYTCCCDDPQTFLELFDELGWIRDVFIPYSFLSAFWMRNDDEFMAEWLVSLLRRGVS